MRAPTRRSCRRGFEIVCAVDGPEGVALAESEQPDIILMDVALGEMDGWEATTRIRANGSTAHIPVIALIGNDAGWTQIRRGQVELYGEPRAVATALDYTRYEKVVEACGGVGVWVEKIEQLGPALDEAFASKKPACINVKIAKSDFRKGAISV